MNILNIDRTSTLDDEFELYVKNGDAFERATRTQIENALLGDEDISEIGDGTVKGAIGGINTDLSELDVVVSKKMTVIDNAPLTQFNLFKNEASEEDCLREIFNTAPVGVPLIGKIFGGTQGIYYGHIYANREYGSLAFLRFNGEIKILQRSFGNETIRTI